MAVVAGGLAGVPHIADQLPLCNGLPGLHDGTLQVGIQSAPAVAIGSAVVDDHKVAVAEMLACLCHNAVGCGQHIGAFSSVQIVAAVAVAFKAGNVGVIRHGVDKQRAVGRILQQRQLAGGGRDNLRGSCRGRGFLRLGCFRCCGGLPGGGGILQSGLHHAGRHAGGNDHRANHHGPGPQAAVMQQVYNARFGAALPKGQAAGHAAPLHGKAQNALAVGGAGGAGLAAHSGFVAGGFHVALKLAERKPRQRIEPV